MKRKKKKKKKKTADSRHRWVQVNLVSRSTVLIHCLFFFFGMSVCSALFLLATAVEKKRSVRKYRVD